jgi:hypothetical protein
VLPWRWAAQRPATEIVLTPIGELRPIERHRFVPRAAIADAAAQAPRIDAVRFRADLDAVIDPRP